MQDGQGEGNPINISIEKASRPAVLRAIFTLGLLTVTASPSMAWANGGNSGAFTFPNSPAKGGTNGTADRAAGEDGSNVTVVTNSGDAGGGGATDITTGTGAHGGSAGLGGAGVTKGTPGATGQTGGVIITPSVVDGVIVGGAGSLGIVNDSNGGSGGGGAGIVATTNIVIGGTADVYGGRGGAVQGSAGGGGGGAGIFSKAKMNVLAGAHVTGGSGGGVQDPNARTPQGGSGAGGMGILLGADGAVTNAGVIAGGAGGSNSRIVGSSGGDGGSGIEVVQGGEIMNLAGGSITGGAGGNARSSATIVPGLGGAGVKGANLTVINAGLIEGGMSGTALTGTFTPIQANAVEFTGGVNTLEIQATSVIDGTAVAFSTVDTLRLGGVTDSSFDVAQVGGTAKYRGFGRFEKSGVSTWTLSGANTALTPWTVSGGVLAVNNDVSLGAVAGTLTLNGGTLQNTAAIVTTRAIVLDSSGTMETDADFSTSGIVSGRGPLTKTGAATLTLTGANTYSGGTTISEGTLVGSATSFGSGTIMNNAALVVDQSADGALPNAISGSGTVTKRGAGQLRLADSNTYTGITTIAAGTLVGTAASFGSGSILNDATLVVDQGSDAAMPNSVSGSGNFTKRGAGRLNVTGTFALQGAVSIEAGALAVNGSLSNSAVNVGAGATLGGNGSVGATTVRAGGNVAPGNSIGTLHVNGAYVQDAGSTYIVELDPNNTNSDLIDVNGTAMVAPGAALKAVKYLPGLYSVGTTYKVLTANGGVAGTYTLSGDTALTPFLAWQDTYDANSAYLKVIQTKSLGDVAETPNESATAQGSAGTAVENPLLNSPSEADARNALDVLSGSSLASTKGALIYDSRYTREMAIDRLRDVFCTVGHAMQDPQANDAPGVAGCMPNRGRYAVWGQTFGGWGHTSGNGNAAGLERSTIGFVTGIDLPVTEHWRAGVLAGYSHGHFNVDSQDARSDSDNYHVGLYGGAQWDKLVLRLGAGYTWHDITSNRSLMLGGTPNSLKAEYDGGTAQSFGELGYQLQAGGFGFEPFVNLAYVNLHTDTFTEDGGAAALRSRSDNTDTTFTTLGARMATDVNIGQAPATLRGMLGWRHAYGDITPKSKLSFAGGSIFTVSGVPIAENAVVLGAGVDLHLTKRATFGVSFEGQYGDSISDNAVRGTLSVMF